MTRTRRTPRLGHLEPLIGLKLRLAQVHFFAVFFEEFGATGLSPAELSILSLLAEQPGLRQIELGRLLRIKRSNMTKLMRGLELRGYVARRASPTDGRTVESYLTPEGDGVQRRFTARVFANDAAAAAALTGAERDMLLGLLDKIVAAGGPAAAEAGLELEAQDG